jgi:hypothetical protein
VTAPRDTSATPQPEWLWGGNPEAIVAQERQGTNELLTSAYLPTDTGGSDEEFRALGFVFGDLAPADPLFRLTEIPEGWRRQTAADADARGVVVVDERGITRVSVFYKAAFYDRGASMHLVPVGRWVAEEAIYGDGPVQIPVWDKLTDGERAEALAWVEGYLERAGEMPQVYTRAARARQLRDRYGPDHDPGTPQ